jgi:hypothetical protein
MIDIRVTLPINILLIYVRSLVLQIYGEENISHSQRAHNLLEKQNNTINDCNEVLKM